MSTQHARSSDGLRIAFRDAGDPSGFPILFIHGYLFSSDVYAAQLSGALAERFRLIAMDMRGHGDSDRPVRADGYRDPRHWADDVAAVIEATGVEHTIVVGWSLGTRVALNYTWFHGFDRIAGFDLISPAVMAPPDSAKPAALPAFLVDLLAEDEEARRQATRTFVEGCAAGGSPETAFLDHLFETAMAAPLEVRRGARDWPIVYEPAISRLPCPVLVTHGIEDPYVTEEAARTLACGVPHGELSLYAESGHLPFVLQAERFDSELAQFTARVSGSKLDSPASR